MTSATQPQSLSEFRCSTAKAPSTRAGSKSDRPIAVQLTDETGRPLEGVAVSFRLPEEGPGGHLKGVKTEIVDHNAGWTCSRARHPLESNRRTLSNANHCGQRRVPRRHHLFAVHLRCTRCKVRPEHVGGSEKRSGLR